MTITRQQVQNAARKLIGAEWHHQGRNVGAGIDCIGGIIYIGLDVGYFTEEEVANFDSIDYGRNPTAYNLLIVRMREYLDEIPINEAREGDILAFRMAGEQVTSHVGTITKGDREYMVIHSLENKTTIEEPLRRWGKYITHAFRLRGIED